MIEAVLTDIEGTTSSINFVHRVLFPHARQALPDFLRSHHGAAEVQPWLAQVAAETATPVDDLPALTAILLDWIDADRKHTALKALQGLIWRDGYVSGAYQAHVYADVPAALDDWHAQGLKLYVYSSGSIAAQRLLFGHTTDGDLRGLFDGYFDTTSGAKRDSASYLGIATAIALPPARILFLSDIEAELDAAAAAGMATILLRRDADTAAPSGRHRTATSFEHIDPLAC